MNRLWKKCQKTTGCSRGWCFWLTLYMWKTGRKSSHQWQCCTVNSLTPAVAIWVQSVTDRVKSFVIFDIQTRNSVRMSKITNDGLTRPGTGCFITVPLWQQCVSKPQRVNRSCSGLGVLPFHLSSCHWVMNEVLLACVTSCVHGPAVARLSRGDDV